ncbi:hypothetical protein LY78DRAFT_338915 [Colletotrichum sublineola]|nr:hypothetical protein LY78DRAFT_338915 [Colletotrichum sublineola]
MESPFFTATPPFWHRGLGYIAKLIPTFACASLDSGHYASPVAANGGLFFLAVSAAAASPPPSASLPVLLSLCLSPPRGISWLLSLSGERFPSPSPSLPSSSSQPWAFGLESWGDETMGKTNRRGTNIA